uniref:Protein kinase domain-containing protein n=1 Tax=viral metagenome TaxID=1070528 RepID=A0A6C0EUF9_9ZZZZ
MPSYKSRKNNKKIKNKKKSLRRRRTYKNRRAVKGVGKGILGIGKDGCIIDSLNCPPYSKDTGYVAKLFKEKNAVNVDLQAVLLSLDPDEKRFAQYKVPSDCPSSSPSSFADNKDVILCKERLGGDIGTIAFMWILEPVDEKHLTKSQYRYLRESLEILHEKGITHGDLPGNVMIHPIDKMPRIIDWGNARISHGDDVLGKQMDNNAFLMHFKIG